MKQKPDTSTSNGGMKLIGAPLDMAVAQALSLSPLLREDTVHVNGIRYAPSRDWVDGGPLIERYRMRLQVLEARWGGRGILWSSEFPAFGFEQEGFAHGWSSGPTPLIAAMRALVDARGLYRSAEYDGGGWKDTSGSRTLALVVELVRLAGTHNPPDLHEMQVLAYAAKAAGVPLEYHFEERAEGAYARGLSNDLAHLAALGILRLRGDRASGLPRYQVGSEAESYLKGFHDMLSTHAAALHAAARRSAE